MSVNDVRSLTSVHNPAKIEMPAQNPGLDQPIGDMPTMIDFDKEDVNEFTRA